MLVMKLFKDDLPLYNSIVNCSFGLGVILFSFIITKCIVLFDYRTSLFYWCALVSVQLVINIFLLGTQDELQYDSQGGKVAPIQEYQQDEANVKSDLEVKTNRIGKE